MLLNPVKFLLHCFSKHHNPSSSFRAYPTFDCYVYDRVKEHQNLLFLKHLFCFCMIFAHFWAFPPAELVAGYLPRIYFQRAVALCVRTSTFAYMNFCAPLLDEDDKEGHLTLSLEPENCFIIFNILFFEN